MRFFDLIQLRISSSNSSNFLLLNSEFDDNFKEFLFDLIKRMKDVSIRHEVYLDEFYPQI
jgi:hypothetical protein